MWIVNLGNIYFKNYVKTMLNGDAELDEYERFNFHIDSLGLKVRNYKVYIFSM